MGEIQIPSLFDSIKGIEFTSWGILNIMLLLSSSLSIRSRLTGSVNIRAQTNILLFNPAD